MDPNDLATRLMSSASSYEIDHSETLVNYIYKDGSMHNAHFSEGAEKNISHCCGNTNRRCEKAYVTEDVEELQCCRWTLTRSKMIQLAEEWLKTERSWDDVHDLDHKWYSFADKASVVNLSDLQNFQDSDSEE